MPNFTAKIRTSYRDIDSLLIDCRPEGLALDGSVWTNSAQSSRSEESGSHTGANNAADLTDSTKMWRIGEHDGKTIYNVTDGSYAIISHTSANTIISLALAGGTDNNWDTGDEYVIGTQKFGNLIQELRHMPESKKF
jgi:hypothetical protein